MQVEEKTTGNTHEDQRASRWVNILIIYFIHQMFEEKNMKHLAPQPKKLTDKIRKTSFWRNTVALCCTIAAIIVFGFDAAIAQTNERSNLRAQTARTSVQQPETPKLQPNILKVKLASHLLSSLGYERAQNRIPLNTVSGLTGLLSKYLPEKIQSITPDRNGLCKAYCYFIYSDSVNFEEYKAKLLGSHIAQIVSPKYDMSNASLGCSLPVNDDAYSYLWHLNDVDDQFEADINAPEAWEFIKGSPDVVIAIVGGGANFLHDPEISTNYWVNDVEDIDHDGKFTAADINNQDDDLNGYYDDVIG